jgi:hypothetical protein
VKRAASLLLLALLPLLLGSCTDASSYEQAIAILVDVSGTYAEEKPEVARIVKRELLPNLVPGDTIALIRIDSESYDKENVEALLTLDRRPSHANSQKLGLAQRLDEFAATDLKSEYTDISGALLLAADYLREVKAGSRVVLVFSDMREELPKGTKREFSPSEFAGMQVLAMNVKQLRSDSADPEVYRERMEGWAHTLSTAQAAGWRTVMDSSKLGQYLADMRH